MEPPKILNRQFSKITEEMIRIEEKDYGITCDDIYEFLIIARQKEMEEKINDALNYTNEIFRRLSVKEEIMKQILEFFEGNNAKEKKDNLKKFLNEHPVFRTTDPKILLQRLKIGQKYGEIFSQWTFQDTPIKDAIDEINAQTEQG